MTYLILGVSVLIAQFLVSYLMPSLSGLWCSIVTAISAVAVVYVWDRFIDKRKDDTGRRIDMPWR